ncbi:MAG TPA: DNA-binding protein [Candidatus Bathyarchaeia archaeon]|nr:DNA-binding protein [Candidatus Bathyarchaeia archaeon]
MIAILDTNALLIPWHFGVDVFEELRGQGFVPATIAPVQQELSVLTNRGSAGAGLALRLLDRCQIIETEEGATVDDQILNTALKYKAAVVTNDKTFKRKLREHGIRVVQLRNKKRLRVDLS